MTGMFTKGGLIVITLMTLGGCATNCKLKGQVLGVLRRQNSVLEALLKTRKNVEAEVTQNEALKQNEAALEYGISSVIGSNQKMIGGLGDNVSCY